MRRRDTNTSGGVFYTALVDWTVSTIKKFPYRLKSLFEREARSVEPRLDGSYGQTDDFGNLFIGPALRVEEENHEPLILGQLVDRVVENTLPLAGFQQFLWAGEVSSIWRVTALSSSSRYSSSDTFICAFERFL